GTIQPIKEISQDLQKLKTKNYKLKTVLHTDACQAAGFLNIRPETLGVDLLSFNGSKIYGPKGVGILFKKNKIQLEPMVYGGSQERGLRAGTENIALVAGLALALELVEKNKNKESKRLAGLRDWLVEKIITEIPETKLNGDAQKRLPNNINISFKSIDGEMLMLGLSRQGFAISTGSACTTSETGPSHVISALGTTKNWGNLRITLGRETTRADLDKFFETLKKEVKRMRNISLCAR
ncbi:MAG: aminotransferase class V-fold PLP-dependent enzyme, partial [Candidatus Taylorbacteria bacterium]|nr:aminotransferase class V-fold PLP-dependent enzyme [Candidatus Taylorbacteria bacterium]